MSQESSRMRVTMTVFACWVLGASAAQAQLTGLPVPRLLSITPAAIQPGVSTAITLTGQDLDEPQGLLFSQAGVNAELITSQVSVPAGKKPPSISPLSFKVQVPANAPQGWIDLRLVNKWGVSNPLPLRVSHVPDVAEKEPNNDADQAQRLDLNMAVNGVIATKTDVDYFVFAGKKGQNVVVGCLASILGSPLDAAIELLTATGKPLASSHHYRGGDALLSCRLPHDGDYLVRVHDFAYSGGSVKHAYQLTVSTRPWIDAVFPPMVEPGRSTKLTLFGRNLPGGKVDPAVTIGGCPVEKLDVAWTAPAVPTAGVSPVQLSPAVFMPPDLEWLEYALKDQVGIANPYVLGVAQAPVALDNGANDSPEKAQQVTLPCEIAGWIEKPRDQDWYAFTATKGDVWDIDVLAERIGSPCDLYFILREANTGKVLTQQDDKAPSLDPARFRFVAPADGAYHLLIASHTGDAHVGPRQLYRVSVRRELPGFKLHLANQPGIGIVRQGASEALPITVTRLGDWNGEIKLVAENLPAGVVSPPQVIGPGVKQTMLALSATADAPLWTGEIRIKGSAVIAGKTVTHLAQVGTTPASHAKGLALAVRETAPFNLTAETNKVVLLQGDKFTVALAASNVWSDMKAPVQVSALNLPAGITFGGKNPMLAFAGKTAQGEVTLVCKADMQPGAYTLLLQGQAQVPFSKAPMAKQANVPVKLASTPFTVTVLPSKVATPSVTPAAVVVKIGKETEMLVKVKRLHDYGGAFKVQLVVPDSIKGVAAAETSIPAGKDEVKMLLKAEPTAMAGPRPGLVVRLVAALPHDFQATHDVKVAVSVVK